MKSGYIFKHLVGTSAFFLILFLSAGRFDYRQGLIYVFIALIMFSLNYTILRIDPELLTERSKPGVGTPNWDKLILGFSFILTILMYVVAGLDSGRYLWSPAFPRPLFMTGLILTVCGQLLFLIAQKQNKFFSSTVRIQVDRNHSVCDTGLYTLVRHPAYLGSILQWIGFPLFFGSLWCIIPAGLLIILQLVRISKEDKKLAKELRGYIEYSSKTRYRILPFIW